MSEALAVPFADELKAAVVASGAARAELIPASAVRTDRKYRAMCESNECGNYGRSWMCSPDVGDIDDLIQSLSVYEHVLVYETVTTLPHGGTFDEYMESGNAHNRLAQSLKSVFRSFGVENGLFLGVGGCRYCTVCAKKTAAPCRFPDRAIASLEAYGIDVSALAAAAGMDYAFEKGRVTYFGAVFF